jgi:predicted ATPase
LVLDTCEHVIDGTAALTEAVLQTGSTVHILATSREPLQVEGEWLFPVSPLGVPLENADNESDPLRYGAVRLFIERARAAMPHFAPDRRDVALIAAICRRVDGIPLAIELAASRVATLGVEELATRLEDRLRLLTSGRRTALPRHRTLRATLDWSYELLAEPERVLLRRLAIFAGPFSLETACAVAAGPALAASDVIDAISSLLTKSLVTTAIGGTRPRFRLLDTTRAYAIEKLDESSESERLARCHAEYYRNLFQRSEEEAMVRPTGEWLANYAREIDNLRAALDWAFSPGGDASIGIALTAAAVALWMRLSLPEECRGRATRALAALGAGASWDARHEMKLHAAVGASLVDSRGSNSPEISVAYTRALELAKSLDDAEYQLRALWGLWAYHTTSGRHLELAQRFYALAAERPDPTDRLRGEGMIGISQFYLGDLPSARHHLEHALVGYVTPDQTSRVIRFQTDLRVWARVFLARILWLQGFPDRAMRAAESGVEDARAANHAVSLCYALAHAACPLALLTGDLAAAEHYGTMLLDHSTRRALGRWRACGRSFQGVLLIQRGDVITGLRLLRAGLDEFGEAGSSLLQFLAFLMAEALGRAGRYPDGLAVIDEAIARSERTEELWAIAELMRVKGELLLLPGALGAAAAAEDHFRQALNRAREQGALSWELRAATSLARLLCKQGSHADAIACLQPVYDRFTEGFGTADLTAAKQLLNELSHGHQQRPTPEYS